MLQLNQPSVSFNETTMSYFPMEDHRAEVLRWTINMTEQGSNLFPQELVEAELAKCETFPMIQQLELNMKKNLKLEKLGSKARIWNNMINIK